MLNLTLSQAKASFFDRKAVKDATDEATRKVLSRFGAYVRQRAKTSIRKRKGTSLPGLPPYSHVGLLRRFILFAYDSGSRSVVIGPVLLKPPSVVPSLLEYGGTVQKRDRKGRPRTAVYPARPYMRPALAAELPGLPDLFKNSVLRG